MLSRPVRRRTPSLRPTLQPPRSPRRSSRLAYQRDVAPTAPPPTGSGWRSTSTAPSPGPARRRTTRCGSPRTRATTVPGPSRCCRWRTPRTSRRRSRSRRTTACGSPIRSGGHSYPGWSAGDGALVVDVRPLDRVSLSGTTATVGAGASLVQVYDALGTRGRGIAGGSCPTVGIAGLTQGGGVGVLTRAHGLTCDSLAVDAGRRSRTARSSPPAPTRTPTCSGRFGAVAAATSAPSRRSLSRPSPRPPSRGPTSRGPSRRPPRWCRGSSRASRAPTGGSGRR